jgi:hypothetical protein
MRALLVLQACLEVAAHLRRHCEQLCHIELDCLKAPQHSLDVVRQYELRIQAYHSSTEVLDRKAQGVLQLVSAIKTELYARQ